MRLGSLFSGVGGFDLGLERAGMTVAWQAETDLKAAAVLAGHWPDVPNLGDVAGVEAPPDVDLICGGFPCQDISVAGTRKGLKGDRSGLWYEFARIIEGSRPRWVLIENVAGLLSSNRGRDLGAILATLGDSGYGWAYRVLDSQYFGVPQRRRRVFIVANLGNGTCPRQVLLECEGGPGDSEAGGEEGEADTRGVEGGPDVGRRGEFVGTLKAAQGGPDDTDAQNGHLIVAQKTHRGRGAEHGDPDLWQRRDVSHTLNTHDDTGGPGRSPTLVVGFDAWHTQVEGVGVRKLTPLECERLQGFPDGWTDNGQADTHRYRQMGNAVTVPVVEWIGRRIMAADRVAVAA